SGGSALFSFVDGDDMIEALAKADEPGRHALIAEFARTLRTIHAWRPDLPRRSDWLGVSIERAGRNVREGKGTGALSDRGRFQGADPRDLLARLRLWRHAVVEEVVLGHGDYCLPNVLVSGGEIVGVVDWGAGGYADRRFDLATARWTILHNLSDL